MGGLQPEGLTVYISIQAEALCKTALWKQLPPCHLRFGAAPSFPALCSLRKSGLKWYRERLCGGGGGLEETEIARNNKSALKRRDEKEDTVSVSV